MKSKCVVTILLIVLTIVAMRDCLFAQGISCNLRATCPQAARWANDTRSVVLIANEVSGETGTGVLLNDVRQDKKLYVLTAGHLYYDAPTNEMTFFFRDTQSCGDTSTQYYNYGHPLFGAWLRASSPTTELDFALFELYDTLDPSWNVYYSGWSALDAFSDSCALIHHPLGRPTVIAIYNGTPTSGQPITFPPTYVSNGFWYVEQFDVGATDSGSSGGPLFDNQHHVGGTLSVITSTGCGTLADNAYFTKFSKAWNYHLGDPAHSLQPWLDPDNSGALVLDGFDPDSVTSVVIDQKLSNNNSADSVWRWLRPQGAFIKLAAPDTSQLTFNTTETYHATHNIVSGQKYLNWANHTDVTNLDTINITRTTPPSTAQLGTTYSGVVIKSEFIDAPSLNAGPVGFNDPWFIDYADPAYGYSLRNRGQNGALWYDTLTSPFNPNTNSAGSGSQYKGVFLNQGGNLPNLTPPYYSVRVPYTQTIGSYQNCNFVTWVATASSPAQFQGASSSWTPVVFRSSTDTLKARYKEALYSSTPVSLGSQPKIAHVNGAPYVMAYESGGDIFFTYSTDGSTWSQEIMLSSVDFV